MHERIWNNCLSVIKDNVPSISFRTWFEPIVPLKLDSDVLTIQVPSPFFYEYLEEQYIDILRKVIKKELGSEAKLEYNVVMQNNSLQQQQTIYCKIPGKKQQRDKKYPCFHPSGPQREYHQESLCYTGPEKTGY